MTDRVHVTRTGHPGGRSRRPEKQKKTTGRRVMTIVRQIANCAVAIREFVAPTYRPERHYMRGPGPACARRMSAQMPAVARAQIRYQ